MVKVGNSECEFLKFTPLSRTAAIAGADSGVTISARRPSGTNRTRLCGVAFCANALVAANVNRLADSSGTARLMTISHNRWSSAGGREAS
jgi:hypothetical protein